MKRKSSIERFYDRIKIVNDCWLWIGRIDDAGYGDFDFDGRTNKAHIFSYEYFVGQVPEDLELDHLCKQRNCVKPEHLEPVTHEENVRRGKWAQQTSCAKGHEYTAENLYINKTSGERICKTCRAEYNRQYRLRKKYAASSR